MILTMEYDPTDEELAIVADKEGIERLQAELTKLAIHGGHTHLMTPSWSGDELTEQPRTEGRTLINHVRLVLLSSQGR